MMSCEQLKRRAFLIEKDPIYADVVINRFENMTGIKGRKMVK